MNNEDAMNSIFFMGFNLDLNLEKMGEKGAFCLIISSRRHVIPIFVDFKLFLD